MLLIKHLFIILICLFFCPIHASIPSYFYRIPDLMKFDTFHERAEKYGADKFFMGAYLMPSEQLRGNLKSVSYRFSDYHIRNTGIVPIPSEITETEKQSILAVFNIILDDNDKSLYMFDKFYDNHIKQYKISKEICTEEYCDFTSSIVIENINFSGIGKVSGMGNKYMPYLEYIDISVAYDR